MKVLGYNGGLDGYPSRFDTNHDSAAALVVNGELVAAAEEERFSRVKHSGAFPERAIAFCLEEAGLGGLEELDAIVFYQRYPLTFSKRILQDNEARFAPVQRAMFRTTVHAMRLVNRVFGYDDARSERVFAKHTGYSPRAGQWTTAPHHLCHASSAYFTSPFRDALCLTLDAQGESVSASVHVARGTTLQLVTEAYAPNSLGYLYAMVTKYLGFAHGDEYKVMGLAPYGDPSRYRGWFRSLVRSRADGLFVVDPALVGHLLFRDALLPDGVLYPRAMVEALGPPRTESDEIRQSHMDVASALQETLEETVLGSLRALRRSTGERNLCLSGGVALNCSMNGRIARSGLFDAVHIHPAAHDAGTSVGAAFHGYHHVLEQPRPRPRSATVYLGPEPTQGGIDSALRTFGLLVSHQRSSDVYRDVAAAIAAGKVVGWYRGRMEWGPRALGHRSILADARRDDMKDVVNHAVKMREGFRPFAPACLEERAQEWFDLTGLTSSPHMLFVVPVLPERRGAIPAVTHVDGSARVQTVSATDDPAFHALLTAFHRLTGVPIVLNTSFNVKGEPIVHTPEDAIRCFLGTQIDLLVMDDVLVEKRAPRASVEDEAPAYDSGRVVDGRIRVAG